MLFRNDNPIELLFILPVLLFSLSAHEFAHSLTAFKLGDTTQKKDGRLTLNPLKHIDWLGFVFLLFAGFGWAKPVMVDPQNFTRKNKEEEPIILEAYEEYHEKPAIVYEESMKHGMAVTALMGPITNFALAVFSFFTLCFIFSLSAKNAHFGITEIFFGTAAFSGFEVLYQSQISNIPKFSLLVLYQMVWYNLILGTFNLIPLPPMDGSKVFSAFLSAGSYFRFTAGGRVTSAILIILILTGAISYIIMPIIYIIFFALMLVAEIMFL